MFADLRQEFLKEAKYSPKLFKDLAKVEQYIAESYKTRAFVELIQNADDAGASKFGIYDINGGFVIANNGRPFTLEDVEALCRSGSSNKQRGGNTIGYRGIGFKSVVNLASRVSIISGQFGFYFNKSSTQKLLQVNFDVPLIRIPHPYSDMQKTKITDFLSTMEDYGGYTTFFIFQKIDQRLSSEELENFDGSSLLFLNHVRQVNIFSKGISRKIVLKHESSQDTNIINITDGDTRNNWQVLSSKKTPMVRVAFKQDGDVIVPATLQESVIHSFTPTVEFSGAYFKINGDYSTDPSRKNIDLDEFSEKSFAEAVTILTNTTTRILSGQTEIKGFFTPFVQIDAQETNRFKALLFKSCREHLEQASIHETAGRSYPFTSLRLKPDWLNFEDYESLCIDGIYPVTKELVVVYPEIVDFLSALHRPIMNLNEVLGRVNLAEISITGCGQIFIKLANQLIYDLDKNTLARIKDLKIFPVGDKRVTAQNITSTKELRREFWDYITSNNDVNDIDFLLKKLGIEIVKEKPLPKQTASPSVQEEEQIQFKIPPQIKKWRSAEKNAAAYLEALASVVNVADVSKANLGYDLEVLLQNGHRIFVEVKSVSNYRETIRLTNNEYSSAHQFGDQYYFAIVLNSDEFELKLISNPINTLPLEKRCERWSWFCETYEDHLQDVSSVDFEQGEYNDSSKSSN